MKFVEHNKLLVILALLFSSLSMGCNGRRDHVLSPPLSNSLADMLKHKRIMVGYVVETEGPEWEYETTAAPDILCEVLHEQLGSICVNIFAKHEQSLLK